MSFKVFLEFLHKTASVTAQVEMTPYDISDAHRGYESARPSAISSIPLLSAQSRSHHLKKPRGAPGVFLKPIISFLWLLPFLFLQ